MTFMAHEEMVQIICPILETKIGFSVLVLFSVRDTYCDYNNIMYDGEFMPYICPKI